MTESEKWKALELTDLTEHDPFCNYGRTNGREMCTCDVLVNIIERVEPDEPEPTFDEALRAAYEGPIRGPSEAAARRLARSNSGGDPRPDARTTRSEQRARRLAKQRASK